MPGKQICPFRFKYKPESLRQRFKNGSKSNRVQSKWYTLNQSAAIAKLKQLNNKVSVDFVVKNRAEKFRLSSYAIFKENLLNPISCILILIIYTLSYLLTVNSSRLSFIIVFAFIYIPINYHLESYASFKVVSKNLNRFRKDSALRNTFLSCVTYRYHLPEHDKLINLGNLDTIDPIDYRLKEKHDTFEWANQLIKFFWPYLSYLIHSELDEFFHTQIESGKLANSEFGAKKFFAALIKQLKSNILEIKRCQFGSNSPEIRNFSVQRIRNEDARKKNNPGNDVSKDESLTYDLDMKYNGNMIIKVIYRYFYCCSSKLGLEDVYLQFKMRFLVGPIKQELPFADRISITLMDLPEFGYKGIALVELAELRIIRGIINRVIRDNILYPKLLSVSMREVMRKLMEGPKKKEPLVKYREKESPCFMRFLAGSLLCGCMCLNMLLKPCHSSRGRHTKNKM